MTRGKVKLAFIENNSERKASYKKRKRGLMKKVQELSILCGVDACAFLYGPFDDQPVMWPSNPDVRNHILTRFKALSVEERDRWMVNQKGFTSHKIGRLKEQFTALKIDNRKIEINNFVNNCLRGAERMESFNNLDLEDMKWSIEQNLKEITQRMDHLRKYSSGDAILNMSTMLVKRGIDVNKNRIGSSSGCDSPFCNGDCRFPNRNN